MTVKIIRVHRGGIYQIIIWWIHYSAEDGGMIRKWPAEHLKPKFLVMAKAMLPNQHARTPALQKASSFFQIICGNFQNGLFRP